MEEETGSTVNTACSIKKLTDHKSMRGLFLICWITYFSTYIGRLNFSASMGDMMISGGFTKSQLGLVAGSFFLAYGLGQLISGVLGDKVSPRLLVFIGVVASSLLNVAMGISSTYQVMVVLWFANGLVQSLTWSPIARLISDRLPRKRCVKALVDLSTTVPAGTLLTYFLCSLLIKYLSWRTVFYMAAGLMLPMAFMWYISISKLERRAELHGTVEEEIEELRMDALREKTPAANLTFHKGVILSGLLFISIGAMLHGFLKDGIMTWVPTYLTDTFNTGTALSIQLTMALPIINLLGVYLSSFLNTHVFKNELVTAAFFFGVTVAAILTLVYFGHASIVLSLIVLGVITSAMLGVNTMLVSLVPLYFNKTGKVSTVSGMLNSTTYIGSAASSYGIGAVAQHFGWGFTRMAWGVLAFLGAGICLFASRKWQQFSKSS